MLHLPKTEKTLEYYGSEFPFGGRISSDKSLEEIFRFCRATYHPDFNPPIIFNENKEVEIIGIPTLENILESKRGLEL